MTIIDNIQQSSTSLSNISDYIDKHSSLIYDFFICQSYDNLEQHKGKIEDYILPYYKIYKDLDLTSNKNLVFILSLLDASERFSFYTEFQTLYNLCKANKLTIGSRLEASSMFLVSIRCVQDYSSRLTQILDLLVAAYLNEEDSEAKVTATLLRLYSEVLHNFGTNNLRAVNNFRNLLLQEIFLTDKNLLVNAASQDLLSKEIVDINQSFQDIHRFIDNLLKRNKNFPFEINSHLIEIDTEYRNMLAQVEAKFLNIRDLCTNLYSKVKSDDIFLSLNRGVKVLTNDNQLLAYMNSYGLMHYEKVMSAFLPLSVEDLSSTIEVYDWGCGQGLASICFIEYLDSRAEVNNVKQVTLIEPSEIALKRASLHVRKFTSSSDIFTLNKDLDSLNLLDFSSNQDNIKIQLFSNILDIDLYSMNNLIQILNSSFTGLNYFVCVSPYVSNCKTQRLDDFVEAFANLKGFKLIESITERSGEWVGTSWTRVVRVFKVEL